MIAKKHFLTRRQALFLGLSTVVGIGTATVNNMLKPRQIYAQNRSFVVRGDASLGQRSHTKGLLYGAAIRQYALSTDPLLAASVARECTIIVPEWELKWNFLRPTPTSFDFVPADWLADFARRQGMLFRGHTLVWHEPLALPPWFKETVNSINAASILENHIQTVVGHYAGRIHSWDVVNEAVYPRDGRSDGLRITPWLKFLGSNYIDTAFYLASAADPKALLVYNDYALDYDTPKADAKRDAVLKLLQRLRSNGVPIHALGIQAHLTADSDSFNPTKLQQFLKNVADLGLKIMITEMDVSDENLPRNIQVRDNIVAGVYEDYLSVVLAEPAVIAVLNWGLSDRYTWLSESQLRKDDAPVRPLPLDSQMQRKLAWNAVARAFDKAPKRKLG